MAPCGTEQLLAPDVFDRISFIGYLAFRGPPQDPEEFFSAMCDVPELTGPPPFSLGPAVPSSPAMSRSDFCGAGAGACRVSGSEGGGRQAQFCIPAAENPNNEGKRSFISKHGVRMS